MTIEKLLDLPSSDLNKISTEEMITHLRKYWPITKPEMQELPKKPKQEEVSIKVTNEKKKQAEQILKQYGFNLKL